MSSTLLLASWLGRLEADRLRQILRLRTLPGGEISDVYDLTRALLNPESLRRALVMLDRDALAAIAAAVRTRSSDGWTTEGRMVAEVARASDVAPEAAASRVRAGLTEASSMALLAGAAAPADVPERWLCPDALVAELQEWPLRGLPSIDDLLGIDPPTVLEPIAGGDAEERDREAAQAAFRLLDTIGELVATAQETPIGLLARGALPLPAARRLSEASGVDLDAVPDVVQLASEAGLVVAGAGRLSATEAAGGWQRRTPAQRWSELASAWHRQAPAGLRTVLASRAEAVWGDSLRDYVEWLYPAGREWLPRVIDEFTRVARRLGVLVGTVPSGFGSRLVAGDPDAAASALDALLPAEVDRVYLLPDLTIVSPGPLRPDVERRLRAIAEPASRGLAATFRLSEHSLQTALTAGVTEPEIRATLTEASLSDVPQPVDYLVSEVVRRHGALRVAPADGDGPERTVLRASDAALLETLLVDRELAILGLTAAGPTEAVSRLTPDVVYWTLREARQPAVLEVPPTAEPTPAGARDNAPRHATAAEPPDRVDALVERVLAARTAAAESPQGDVLGRLQLAIKDRQSVRVAIALPGGGTASYVLTPSAIAAGRLRAIDQAAQVERTLPLSSITAIEPA